MSTERNGITGDAGSSSIDGKPGFIAPGPGGGGGSIEKDFSYIARKGWGGLTACIALVFALSGCVALPDTECLRVGPAYTCEAEHGNGFVGGALDRPDRSTPEPDVPDDDQCNNGDTGSDRDDKPGWGRGDKKHDHSGPPGQNK